MNMFFFLTTYSHIYLCVCAYISSLTNASTLIFLFGIFCKVCVGSKRMIPLSKNNFCKVCAGSKRMIPLSKSKKKKKTSKQSTTKKGILHVSMDNSRNRFNKDLQYNTIINANLFLYVVYAHTHK